MDNEIVETETVEQSPESPVETMSYEDRWENLSFTPEPEPENVEDVAVSESPKPSDTDLDSAETEGSTEEVEEDDLEQRLENHEPDKPVKLSRRATAKVIDSVIEPLRDDNVPIGDVANALYAFNPTRAQALAEELVYNSLKANPDAWIKELTGLDKSEIEELQAISKTGVSGGGQPAKTASDIEFGTLESKPEIAAIVEQLTDLYGEDWRDPANDSLILEEDLAQIKSFRAQLAYDKELHQRLKDQDDKILLLEPKISEIEKNTAEGYAQKRQEFFNASVNSFRDTIEGKAFPRVFKAKGLEISNDDTEDIKELKTFITSDFKSQNNKATAFDVFLENDFSGKEMVEKSIQRVGVFLDKIADLELQAYKDPKNAAQYHSTADSLKAQAKHEEDALSVWTQKAATEFIDKKYTVVWRTLERISALEKRSVGRPEIISTNGVAPSNSFRNQVKEAVAQGINPFDMDISNQFGIR